MSGFELFEPCEYIKDKVFDLLFRELRDNIKSVKEKKELRDVTQRYFDAYFEDIDFNGEFDYELVTEYLLKNYSKIFSGELSSDVINEMVSGAIARGKGNAKEIKRYCKVFISFWESIVKRNIPREDWYLLYEVEKIFNKKIERLYEDLQNILTLPKEKIYLANKLYVDSFCETLFLHREVSNSKVNLSNLFVIQNYIDSSNDVVYQPQSNLVDRIAQFIKSDNERILFIEGNAGSGKSSLIGYLNYHYSRNDSLGQKLFENKTLATIRLRDLDRSIISGKKSISSAFLSYVNTKSFDDFESICPNAVVVLDGFDELCMIDNISNYEQLIYDLNRRFSSQVKIIITSRPKYISLHNINIPSSSLFLLHFDNEKRMEWIDNYTSPNKCNEKIDEKIANYILTIDDSEAKGVCDTPMSLYMLASKRISDSALNNIWELYHQIFYYELSETEYNKMFPNDERDYSHKISEYRDLIYQITEEIAFYMYRSGNNKFYITSKELKSILEKVMVENSSYDEKIIKQLTEKCYALCSYWKTNSDHGAIEFYHNNIRDFFLCEKIFRELNNLYFKYSDRMLCLSKEIINKFKEMLCFGSLEITVCKFLLLRATYDKDKCKSEFPQIEKQISCLTNVFGFLLSDISSIDLIGKNPIKFMVNLLTNIVQVYRHIYEPYLLENERITWWNDVKGINENGILPYVFHSIFSKVPVTLDYDQALTMASKCNFRGVVLSHCDLRNIGFQGSDLTDADLSDAILNGCDFSDSILENINFNNARLEYASLIRAKLTGATFFGAQLRGAYLPNGVCSDDQVEQIELLKKHNINKLQI